MMGEEGIIILIYWKVSHVFHWNITKLLLYIWHSGNFKDFCQRTTRAVLSCSGFQLLLTHSHLQKCFFEPVCSDCWYCLWWHPFGWYLVLCNYWVLFLLMRVFWGKKKKFENRAVSLILKQVFWPDSLRGGGLCSEYTRAGFMAEIQNVYVSMSVEVPRRCETSPQVVVTGSTAGMLLILSHVLWVCLLSYGFHKLKFFQPALLPWLSLWDRISPFSTPLVPYWPSSPLVHKSCVIWLSDRKSVV